MAYCFLQNLPRLLKHLTVNDRRHRRMLVANRQARAPFKIDTWSDREAFSFQVVGDTGEGDRSQDVIIDDLNTMPMTYPDSLFMLNLGDVVYPDGSRSDYEKRFFYPYRHYPLPILAVTGNHDWYSYLNGYERHFLEISPAAKLFGRTQVLQPNIYYFIETKRARVICLDSGKKGRINPEQLAWLQQVCSMEPSDKPKILALHHPLYSNDKRNRKLADVLEPIINQHEIRLVLSAHVHNYQKYEIVDQQTGHTTVHIVSGAGGAGLSPTQNLRELKLVTEFYPSVAESRGKFPRFLFFTPPAPITTCSDSYPYYKSFVNVSIRSSGFRLTVFTKKGFVEPLNTFSQFTV